MRHCCRALRLLTQPSTVSSLIYGFSLLPPIDFCIDVFYVGINTLIAFVFPFKKKKKKTLASFIPQNKAPK